MKTQKPAVRRLDELVPGAQTSMWCVSLPDAAANKWSALNAVKLSPAMRAVPRILFAVHLAGGGASRLITSRIREWRASPVARVRLRR